MDFFLVIISHMTIVDTASFHEFLFTVGTSGDIFAIGLKCYLVTFLALGLVGAGDLLVSTFLKYPTLMVTNKLRHTQRWVADDYEL